MPNSTPSLAKLSRSDKELIAAAIIERNRRKAKYDCVLFVREFLWTFDPRPDVANHDMPFNLYPFQEEAVLELVEAIYTGFDEFFEKSRDMGVTWLALAVILWFWLYEPGFQALLGSRKEQYVDNWEIDSLFGKLDYFVEHLDPELLPEGFDQSKHRTSMKLVNPANGNTIQGESANKNFSRSGRYTVVFYDEFGFWPDAKRSWTAGGDATKCRIAVTTPPDEPSFAKTIRYGGQTKVRTLHWRLHPRKDDAWYAYEKSRRTEEEVLHELDISWEYSTTGRPYPEVDRVSFGQFPYDPKMPLYVSLDVGLDAIAAGWYQPVLNSDWLTLVDAYEVSDEIIDWFVPLLGKEIDPRFVYTDDALAFIEQVKYWKAPIVYGDPSGHQRHVESGFSAYSTLAKSKIYVQVNTQDNEWPPRRDAMKKTLMHLRVNDTPRTRWWQECVKSAHYPKRDPETSQATTPVTKPVHDWTSHHRTQTEFFAVNYRPVSQTQAWHNRNYRKSR